MRQRKCPTCCRDFKPMPKPLFCPGCRKLTPHFDATVNRVNRGNNYPECAECGAETTVDSSRQELERYNKDPAGYVAPEPW